MNGQTVPAALLNPDEIPEEIRAELSRTPDMICVHDGSVYLKLKGKVCRLPDEPAGREFAFFLKLGDTERKQKPQNLREVYDRVLNDPDYLPDSAMTRRLGIDKQDRLCVIVFRTETPQDSDMATLTMSMAPIGEKDGVIPLDYRTAALVRNLEDMTGEETAEFTQAVIGTMEAEGFDGIRAGIGRETVEMTGLRLSLQEGLQAIRIGSKYQPHDSVYIYERQTLEKIADAIPPEKRKAILQLVFGESGETRLTDEMLDTVQVFFDNDLNLTAASKQLFIHRNTLNYRLDKINKEFGLDLRSFRDAVIFKLVLEMTDKP